MIKRIYYLILYAVKRKVTSKTNHNLIDSLMLKELQGVINKKASKKTLRSNRIVVEFFQAFWNNIGEPYLKIINPFIDKTLFLQKMFRRIFSYIKKQMLKKYVSFFFFLISILIVEIIFVT